MAQKKKKEAIAVAADSTRSSRYETWSHSTLETVCIGRGIAFKHHTPKKGLIAKLVENDQQRAEAGAAVGLVVSDDTFSALANARHGGNSKKNSANETSPKPRHSKDSLTNETDSFSLTIDGAADSAHNRIKGYCGLSLMLLSILPVIYFLVAFLLDLQLSYGYLAYGHLRYDTKFHKNDTNTQITLQTVACVHTDDSEYGRGSCVNLYVGSKHGGGTVKLYIDTGSPGILSYNDCASSARHRRGYCTKDSWDWRSIYPNASRFRDPVSPSFDVVFGDESKWTGTLGLDTLTVGSAKLEGHIIGSIGREGLPNGSRIADLIHNRDIDSILGLSLEGNSAAGRRQPLIQHLFDQRLVPDAIFGLNLYRVPKRQPSGQITLGGVDIKESDEVSRAFFALDTRGYGIHTWTLGIRQMRVGNVPTIPESSQLIPMILDSGTPFIRFPYNTLSQHIDKLPGGGKTTATIKGRTQTFYSLWCNASGTDGVEAAISFEIGNQNYQVPVKDLISNTDFIDNVKGHGCFLDLEEASSPHEPGILGLPFFHHHYIGFDAEYKTVMVSRKKLKTLVQDEKR